MNEVHIRRPTRSDPQFVIFRADAKRVLIVRRKSAAGAANAARELGHGRTIRVRCFERWFEPAVAA